MAISTYSLQLGPMRFVTALEPLTEQLGDALESVGTSLIAGERRARSFPLTLPVYGATSEADMRTVGLRMRRQLRQLMENTAWKIQGLPLAWEVDPDMDCWLLVGGGDMEPKDGGISFGEWTLKLTDCFIVARPGTHRAGRRIDIADRRFALADRAFGTIYTTDYSATVLAAQPVAIPGDVEDIFGTTGAVTNTAGPSYASRTLYRACASVDGNVITYEPYRNLAAPGTHAIVDPPGQVRLWDIGTRCSTTPIPLIPGGSGDTGRTRIGDLDPDLYYEWERILGPVLKQTSAMAIDNGVCRVRWAGSASGRGLWIETWDNGAPDGYVPLAYVSVGSAPTALWMIPVEVTPEQVVIEYGTRDIRHRVTLQRGWWGPRIEVLRTGATASLRIALFSGDASAAATPSFVRELKLSSAVKLRAAASHAAVTAATLSGATTEWTSTGPALALQVSCGTQMLSALELAGLSLEDARAVPVLVPR